MNAVDKTLANSTRHWRRVAVFCCSVGALVLAAGRLVMRCEVVGSSMVPVLNPGDRVVFFRRFRSQSLQPGRIVAFEDPRGGAAQLMIKRVFAVRGDEVVVLGDNARASTDSRTFGPIRAADVEWVFVRRYARATRTLVS